MLFPADLKTYGNNLENNARKLDLRNTFQVHHCFAAEVSEYGSNTMTWDPSKLF